MFAILPSHRGAAAIRLFVEQARTWVPANARKRIVELLSNDSLSPKSRELIVRLATFDAMKTDVWEKLPKGSSNLLSELVDHVHFAVTGISNFVSRPGPKAKKAVWKRWSEIIHEHPPLPSTELAAMSAADLFGTMHSLRDEIDASWLTHWRGDQSFTSARVTEILEHLERFQNFSNH